MDRWLADLRAAPLYQDPFYGYRPGATGAGDLFARQTPVAELPGGPLPSTPAGTTMPAVPAASPWNLGALYDPTRDAMSGYRGEDARGRLDRWVNDGLANAQAQGLIPTIMQRHGLTDAAQVRALFEQVGAGGVQWAEQVGGAGASGFHYGADPRVAPNTLNPGEAARFLAAGRRPGQYDWDAAGIEGGRKTRWDYAAGDQARAAAQHVTQALSGGQGMPNPGLDPGLGGGGLPGLPGAGSGHGASSMPTGGGLSSITAEQLLSDPAALQAYISAQAGAPIGNQSFRSQFVRSGLTPMIQSAIQSLTGLGGETTTDMLGQNIQHYLGMLGGQGGFGALRGEATSALRNPELWGNLGLLKDQEAAQRLNQLIGLATAGTGDLYGSAVRQRGLNALEQKHVSDAFLPLGATAPTYADYFKALPWLQMVMGGG